MESQTTSHDAFSNKEPVLQAPSNTFLFPTHICTTKAITDRGTAVVGPETGFLPPYGLEHLPAPYCALENALSLLPSVCKSGSWSSFALSIPHLSLEDLPDHYLLRANACLGAIAHALHNIASLPIPHTILSPWKLVATRLSRETPSLTSLDFSVYNFEILQSRFIRLGDPNHEKEFVPPSVANITDAWSQTRPSFSLTGCMTEHHLNTSFVSIEIAARRLPGVVATAQQAVVNKDNNTLCARLIDVIGILEQMTTAFQSSDPRPLSSKYIDPVEFGRCVGQIVAPVLPGEKTVSGLIMPSIHLIDAFLDRKNFESNLGKLATNDRRWLPPLHLKFLHHVREVSVSDYIHSLPVDNVSIRLRGLFRRVVDTYANESGFLGKHRIKVFGFIEVGAKVGRVETVGGTETNSWESRQWEKLNSLFQEAIHERLMQYDDRYISVKVMSSSPLQGGNADRVVMSTDGSLVYKPGDHIEVLPRNPDGVVRDTIEVLGLQRESLLNIRCEQWKRALSDHGIPYSTGVHRGSIQVSAESFFEIASLVPLDYELGRRLANSLFCINPAVRTYLAEENTLSVPVALSLLASICPVSPKFLVPHIDEIFRPLIPRMYSVASNIYETPNKVELVVGHVQYTLRSKLPSFAYGKPIWRRRALALQSSQKLHTVSTIAISEKILNSEVHAGGNEPGEDLKNVSVVAVGKEVIEKTAKEATDSPDLPFRVAKILQQILASAQSSSPGVLKPTTKAILRAQIINLQAKMSTDGVETVRGVCSSYLSRLGAGETIRVRSIPEIRFHMPEDPEVPIIMFALGSGMATFRSFLLQLIHNKKAMGSARCRQAWLIIGVRSVNHIPFLEDLKRAVCREGICHISVAVSREDVDLDKSQLPQRICFHPGTAKHIPDLFDDVDIRSRFWSMISSGGHVHVCGRPELDVLVRDIIATTANKFAKPLWGMTYSDIHENLDGFTRSYADRMVAEERFHIDTYYSKKAQLIPKIFTYSTVAEHRSISSCWAIFRDNVYDISRYLHIHPGGPKILLDKLGRDISADFDIAHGVNNDRVVSMFSPYRIGYIEPFPKASKRIKRFMYNWSIPVSHGALEHRGVSLLSWNGMGEELNEPRSHSEWQSHYSSGWPKAALQNVLA